MSGDEKLRERFVQAYLHNARPVPVILKELGVSKVQARAWRQSEGLNRARLQRSLVDQQYQQVVALVESGRSVLSAIEEVGFPQSLAYRYLAQDGLELVRSNRGGTAQPVDSWHTLLNPDTNAVSTTRGTPPPTSALNPAVGVTRSGAS